MMPKQKAFKIEEIPAVNEGAKRLKIIYGPYKLRAANVVFQDAAIGLCR
jgi:hypothetical protein